MNIYDEGYDFRQYQRMLQTIARYQNDEIALDQLIGNLEALGDTLQNKSESWLEMFEPSWGVLEDVHSVMLYEGREDLYEEDRKLIQNALKRLRTAIKGQMSI